MEYFFPSLSDSSLWPQLRERYQGGKPFPHLVVDNFIPLERAQRLREVFPSELDQNWISYKTVTDQKLGSRNPLEIPLELRQILNDLASVEVIAFLEEVTGINGLLADPWLRGGGLHQTSPGGFLDVHTDFNRHPKLSLVRRVNLIVYLTPDGWREEYNGQLELWDKEGQTVGAKILPIFNRCVIFETSDSTLHGHPVPLACPESWTRRSLATYYYTVAGESDVTTPARNTVYYSAARGERKSAHTGVWIAKPLVASAKVIERISRKGRQYLSLLRKAIFGR